MLGQIFFIKVKFSPNYQPDVVLDTVTHFYTLKSVVFRTLSLNNPSNQIKNNIFLSLNQVLGILEVYSYLLCWIRHRIFYIQICITVSETFYHFFVFSNQAFINFLESVPCLLYNNIFSKNIVLESR